MPTTSDLISVVILNYRLADQVIRCIKSVKQSTYPNIKIIVVDNASGDDIQQQISLFKDESTELILSDQNLGYSGGNNLGIKRALDLNSKYILVLNPDTVIDKSTIKKMHQLMEDQKLDLATPKIYFLNDQRPPIIWYAGGILDLNNVLGSHRGVDQVDQGQFDQLQETEYLTGAAIMAKAEVFKKIGLFDERYFLYYEDSDFSYRARLAGYKLWYLPQAVIYHQNAQTTGLGSPRQDYYITRNRFLFAWKFLPWRTRFALVREGLRNFNNPIRRRAMIDFFTNRLGNAKI